MKTSILKLVSNRVYEKEAYLKYAKPLTVRKFIRRFLMCKFYWW